MRMKRDRLVLLKTLREQVYDYLREALNRGDLAPGVAINLAEISEKLGVSKTPLRFALIQLENEGFVTIIPRRGCVVNILTLAEIRNIYQIIGALESSVILAEFRRITPKVTRRMRRHNEKAKAALVEDSFDRYYEANLKVHDCFLELSSNEKLVCIATILKNRLYDFPRKKRYVKEWEVTSTSEHEKLIGLLEKRDGQGAADYVRNVHWSYKVQKRYIEEYYTEALEVVRLAR
jgi:DNA-binding GntR family transcriptional regulator